MTPDEKLKRMALEYLLETKLGQNFVEVMNIISDAQQRLHGWMNTADVIRKNAEAYQMNEDGADLANLRIGTVLILAIVNRMSGGKTPKDFTNQDWQDVALAVSQFGVMADGETYAEFVFLMYARYIEISADVLESYVSDTTIGDIRAVTSQLREMSRKLEAGTVSENTYTEECLWLSLEGMTRLITALLESKVGKEFGQLATASAMLAFETGRCRLYQREQALLTEYIEHQYQLDEQLAQKFAEYQQLLEVEEMHFNQVAYRAFAPEFRYDLEAAADLARACGVKEEDIIKSVEDIDAIFM